VSGRRPQTPQHGSVHWATGGGYPTEETVYEFGYRVQATQWAYIQPDLQYITNPYGTGNIPNAVVIGAQFGLVF